MASVLHDDFRRLCVDGEGDADLGESGERMRMKGGGGGVVHCGGSG